MSPEANDIVRRLVENPGWNPIGDMITDAARYRWLRDGNAYLPEERMVRGGEDLDTLCDMGMRRDAEPPPPKRPRFTVHEGQGIIVMVHVPSGLQTYMQKLPRQGWTLRDYEDMARVMMRRLLAMAPKPPVHYNTRCQTHFTPTGLEP